ncbi:MAG: WecB/TagA/CpsF family glycosyltransferase [Anaerolineaceae bacterium]|nr:WecB/TagA/CpsF family glycosyltransferase [Anaerolineaceae bacterium]
MKFIPKQEILGVYVSVINLSDAIFIFRQWISDKKNKYVCVTPAHALMDCHQDKRIRNVYNQAGLVTPDGMAVVWILKLLGHKEVGRVYGPDLMNELCRVSLETGYKHFFYGNTVSVLSDLKEKLEEKFPGIQIIGSIAPPFRELTDQEDEEICKRISASGADILWVGLGSPKQELWMYHHQGKIDVPVMIGVGAAFDFLSGNKSQAPRWIQRSGLEWFYRFLQEPKRLWKRYLLGYPRFVVLIMIELFKKRILKR